jgi:hypothetical protein
VYSAQYTSRGDTIVTVDTIRYCDGSSLVVVLDTVASVYTVSGNTLTVLSYDTLDSWTIVRSTDVYVAVGSTDGIVGAWCMVSTRDSVIMGDPYPSEMRDILMDSAAMAEGIEKGNVYLVVTAGALRGYFEGDMADLLLHFLESDSTGYYDLSFTKENRNKIKIHGNLSGTDIYASISTDMVITYESGGFPNQKYAIETEPTECPWPPQTPAWLVEFYNANMTMSWADILIDSWEQESVFADFDITVEKASDNKVLLVGNMSGEIMSMEYDERTGTVTYSSSDPAHPPTSDTSGPDWFADFLMDNYDFLQKRPARPVRMTAPLWPRSPSSGR